MEKKSGNEGIPYTKREDFDIDEDVRSPLFDTYLLNRGFKYIGTLMGRYGGQRQYEYRQKDLYVAFSRHPSKPLELWWYINILSDGKPLQDGTGLPMLILKLNKYI